MAPIRRADCTLRSSWMATAAGLQHAAFLGALAITPGSVLLGASSKAPCAMAASQH
jgi:hypothetical protein